MAVPYTFGSATTSIPLSQLDSNFATAITLGNTAVQLGNTITTLTGVTNLASSGSLTLGSNGNTTAITIDTSQNVLIGTTTNTAGNRLAVVGSGIQLSAGTTAQEGIRITRATGIAQINGINNDNNAYNAISFATGASEAMRILSTGNILSLSGGSTTATGTGIAFPATQSASSNVNTLDDYEEGTWTPVFAGNSPAGSATYSSQIGTYTKIGNMVNVRFQLTATSIVTGGGGVLLIKGLPFGFGGSAQNGGGGSITIWDGLASGVNTSVMYGDAGNVYLVPCYAGSVSATTITYWAVTTIKNTSSVAGVATYYVD